MRKLLVIVPALTIALTAAAGIALGQAPAAPAAPPGQGQSPGASAPAPAEQPSATTDVKKWTLKQWYRARKEWAKDKARWADCQQQEKTQNLSGRAGWSFLYTCMTAKS